MDIHYILGKIKYFEKAYVDKMKDNKRRTIKDLNNIPLEDFDNSATDTDFISVMKLITVTTYLINILLQYAMLSSINR